MTAVATRSAPGGALTGLRTMLGFALRRDRVRLPVWVLGLTVTIAATAVSFPGLYASAEERHGLLLTINNPGTTALIGAVYGDGDYTYGIMVGHQLLAMTAVIAALMSIFTVVRHTRAEEESGRAELVRSSVVGRHTSAATAMLIVLGANLALAGALAVSLGALGIDTVTWSGSIVFGAAVGAVGLVFAGVAAITVQLTESARAASSSAGLVLAGAYAIRAVGDVAGGGVAWASPIGWAQASEPYYSNTWYPLAVCVIAAAALVAIAVPLSRRRDVGAGVFGTRPGRARGGRALGGPVGLAWRINRGVIIGWSVAMGVFGLAYGPVLSEADSFLSDLPIMAEFLPDLEASGAELFGSLVIAIAAVLCAVPGLQVVLRLRSEELAGRADTLVATPLSRGRWAASSLLLSAGTAAVTLASFGVGMGIGAGVALSDMNWVLQSLAGSVNYLPAVMVVIAAGALCVGIVPRASGAAWIGVGYPVIALYFGGLLDLPQWAMNLSPFSHVPQLPAGDFAAAPLAWLVAIALALAAVGVAGVRRRDIGR